MERPGAAERSASCPSLDSSRREAWILLGATLAPLLLMRVLVLLDVPLGKPGTFVYLYSPYSALRLKAAELMLPVAAAAGAAVWLIGSPQRRRRAAGWVLALAALLATGVWSYAAPPGHLAQHTFNFQSPSHEGAFVMESRQVGSWRTYLAGFPQRARTPREALRGTRVISNPPGTTLLAAALRAGVREWPWLRALAMRPFGDELSSTAPETVEDSMVGILMAWVLTGFWIASAVPLYAIGRLYFDPPAAAALAACIVVTPATLTLTPGKDAAQLLSTAVPLYLWLAACRRQHVGLGAAAGVAAVLASMIGLVHVWVGLIVLAATTWQAIRNGGVASYVLRCLLPAVGGVLAASILLRAALGLDVSATMTAVSRSQAEVTRGPGSMPLAWQALGLPLFMLFAGPAFWVALLARRRPGDAGGLSRVAGGSAGARGALPLTADETVKGLPLTADGAVKGLPASGAVLMFGAAAVMIATVGFTNIETPRLWIPFVPLILFGAALRGGTAWRGSLEVSNRHSERSEESSRVARAPVEGRRTADPRGRIPRFAPNDARNDGGPPEDRLRNRRRKFLAVLVACQLAGSAVHWSFMDMRESEMRLTEGRFFK